MQPNPRHELVERRFRDLIHDAGLAGPDRVGYELEAVVFYWDTERVAVCVDFDDTLPPAADAYHPAHG